MKVGFIGLGIMGKPMALNLADSDEMVFTLRLPDLAMPGRPLSPLLNSHHPSRGHISRILLAIRQRASGSRKDMDGHRGSIG